ncbi:MAG: hypothetical protein ACYDAO_07310 [Thermoplasmataceae archaeon]
MIEKYKIARLEKVCLFYNNIGRKKTKYGQETDFLKNLFNQWSPFHYGIKLEGGKSFALPLLGSIIEEIVREPKEVNVYCMVDLDSKTKTEQLTEIIAVIKLRMNRLSMKYDISMKKSSSFLGNCFYKSYYEISIHYNNETLIIPLTILLANPTLEVIVAKHYDIIKNKVKEADVKKFASEFKTELLDLM